MKTNEHFTIPDHEHDGPATDNAAPEAPRTFRPGKGGNLVESAHDGIDENADVRAAVDRNNGWEDEPNETPSPMSAAQLRSYAGEVLRDLLEWFNEPQRPELIARRVRVVTLLLRPDMLAQKTQESLARAEGCTKANICALSVSFRDRFNFRSRSARTDAARENMSAAALANSRKGKSE